MSAKVFCKYLCHSVPGGVVNSLILGQYSFDFSKENTKKKMQICKGGY